MSSGYREVDTRWPHGIAFTQGMDHTASRADVPRFPKLILIGLAVVSAAIIGMIARQSLSTSMSSSMSSPAPSASGAARVSHHGQPGEADGLVLGAVSVFDDEIPAVANLDPNLLTALRRAAADAATEGVEFLVNSGWRSPDYQEQLLREAVSEYGSEAEAARWVGTATTSAHVSGHAVDIGPFDATAWLAEQGAHYGLCQTYRNESWHYELRPEATSRGCPRMYDDPTHDPRMQP
jgi:hypothetical protein